MLASFVFVFLFFVFSYMYTYCLRSDVSVNVHGACIGHHEIVQSFFCVCWDDEEGLARDKESPDKKVRAQCKETPGKVPARN